MRIEDAASTTDRVAAELRRALYDGEVEAGTPLREVALATELGVSRPTVREALAVLVTEGLAVREPNRGVSVTRPDATSVADVCAVRLVLEGAGVRAWPDAGPERQEHVRASLAAYIGAVGRGATYQELNERHLAFHVSLVELTGSPRLVAMARSVVAELRLALAQVDRIRRNAHDQADSHAALVSLLDAGRLDGPDGAHAFLVRHLADAETAILDALALT